MASGPLSLVPVALAMVTAVLFFGIANMRGDNLGLSQKLMRWRVALQFLAIGLILVTIWTGVS